MGNLNFTKFTVKIFFFYFASSFLGLKNLGVSILALHTIVKVIILTETTKKCILIKNFVISLFAIRQNWICYVIRTGRLGLSIKKGLSKLRYLNLA